MQKRIDLFNNLMRKRKQLFVRDQSRSSGESLSRGHSQVPRTPLFSCALLLHCSGSFAGRCTQRSGCCFAHLILPLAAPHRMLLQQKHVCHGAVYTHQSMRRALCYLDAIAYCRCNSAIVNVALEYLMTRLLSLTMLTLQLCRRDSCKART